MLHDAIRRVLVRRDDFTRDRSEPVVAQPVLERVVGRVEAYAQRVAIERLQTFDLRVVVEAVGLARTLQGRVETDEPTIEEIEPIRAQLRIEDALDAVYIIFRDELALPALERRIVGEVDAGPHLHRERAPAVGDLRHALGGVGDEAHRAGKIVVGVERIEDRVADFEGIRIVDRLRIEAVFRDRKRDMQRLPHVRGMRAECEQHYRDRGAEYFHCPGIASLSPGYELLWRVRNSRNRPTPSSNRSSLAAKHQRTKPWPSGPKALPGARPSLASRTSCLQNSKLSVTPATRKKTYIAPGGDATSMPSRA